MHSSTLVVAGIYLLLRLIIFVEQSWLLSVWLIIWGAWTATFAAFIACFQYELKIILAYSTISSMGFMFFLIGLHAYYEALIYLIVHAFIKIFLFLVVGAIMLHCSGCQDVRWMGGLLNYIPFLWITYLSGAVGLAGLPYWSGYYCKSTVWNAVLYLNDFWSAIIFIILLNSLFTYLYLLRLGILIFKGLKLGHRSIYRVRWQSLFIVIFFNILLFVVLYGGSIWTSLLEIYNISWHLGWNSYFNLFYNLQGELTYWGWWGLNFIYILFFIFIYLFLSLNTTINKYWLYKWWLITLIFNIFIIIYVLL
jgi:NADH-quinone oxidoreductase subunit L